MGTTVKSAWSKTTGAVTGMFAGNKKDDEESDFTDPLRLDNMPTSIGPEVYVANGQLWESTGDFGKAMESYAKALGSEPNNVPALTSIARLHFRQGNHQKAADYFKKALAESPSDAGLHNDLGLTLSKLGDHRGAGDSLARALQLAPGTSRYANNLASVQFEAGDQNAAFSVLNANNKPAVAHFNMAYLHFKKGQMVDARQHLASAMKFEPQAAQDSAVKRAIDRSRDMLAQIDAAMSPIAQAAPQTRIAGVPNGGAIQQTSQATPNGASTSVSPAAPVLGPGQPLPWKNAPASPSAPTWQPPSSPGVATEKPSIPFTMPTGTP